MSSAREIIAYTIPGSSAEFCFGVADAVIERLTEAGYAILAAKDVARLVEIANRNEASPEGESLALSLKGGRP